MSLYPSCKELHSVVLALGVSVLPRRALYPPPMGRFAIMSPRRGVLKLCRHTSSILARFCRLESRKPRAGWFDATQADSFGRGCSSSPIRDTFYFAFPQFVASGERHPCPSSCRTSLDGQSLFSRHSCSFSIRACAKRPSDAIAVPREGASFFALLE